MTFNKNKLYLISNQAIPGAAKVWGYSVPNGDDVTASDYFNSAASSLTQGDTIIASEISATKVLGVTSISGNSVGVTAIGGGSSSGSGVYHSVVPNISSASSVYIPIDKTGNLSLAQLTLGGAISTADANITIQVVGEVFAAASAVVPTAGSADGATTPTPILSSNGVSEGSVVKVSTDGASSGDVPLSVTLVVS